MSSAIRKKPKYNILDNGYTLPISLSPKIFEESLTYIAEPGDVFICTYPKCGTTWTQNILYLMLSKGKPLEPEKKICKVIPHLEMDGKEAVMALPKPRIIKTHLPYQMLPKNKDAKYIVVCRNPKDCCVSFYYHTKGFVQHYDYEDGKFEDYFELFLRGEVDCGDYFDHLLSYLFHKNDSNMLFLLFEDMKSDIRQCIRKIGQFLGEPFINSIEDPDVFEKIIQTSSFNAMKSTPSLWSSAQVKGSPGFIRKGEVGDWKKHFTNEQAKLLDQKFKAKLGGTEAEHFWDGYDC